ncbi:MAG: DUF2079 domain-containing protein [Thermoplasmataceae archaeon]
MNCHPLMMDGSQRARFKKWEGMIIVAAIAAYATLYSTLSIIRFLTYNAYVYDLGLSSSLLYSAVHNGTYFFLQNPGNITANKMIYIPLAVIFQFYPNFIPLLIFQSIWIAVGAYPLYKISKKVIADPFLSLIPSVLYLLYYPLAGVNWYDFHFMALFPTFFFFGFWLYLCDRKVASALVLFLAAMTNYLAAVIILLFGLETIFSKRGISSPTRNKLYGISLVIFPSILFLIINMHFGVSYTTSVSNVSGFPFSLFAFLPLKLFLVFSLFFPLFFISLYSPKYLLLALPYFAFVFFQGSHLAYFSPINFQYPSLVIPGLFISFVYGFRRLMDISMKAKNSRRVGRVVKVIVAVNVCMAVILTPVGSIISGNSTFYDGQPAMTYTVQDSTINAMIAQIPLGSSVMIQANMPQLTAGYDWMVAYEFNGTNYPKFAIDDPYDHLFNDTEQVYLSNTSQEVRVFNEFLNSGGYGIVDEQYGIILLERNWTGHTKFIPLEFNHSLAINDNGSAALNLSENFIAPGTYNVTVYLGQLTAPTLNFSASMGNRNIQGYAVKKWDTGNEHFISCSILVGTSYYLAPHFSIVLHTNFTLDTTAWVKITQDRPSL